MPASLSNHRLVLGTAQLGMAYGIANTHGKPDLKTALEIIQTAFENGISEFDTAQGYGNSEEVLGQCFKKLEIRNKVRVISKLDPGIDHGDKKALSAALDRSLKNLDIPTLEGLLLHRAEMLNNWDDGLGDILRGFVKSGKVKKIGVSVYSPEKALEAVKISGLSIIQFPANVFDRRFMDRKFVKHIRGKEISVYARSVFLQGLLLMNVKDIPARLKQASKYLQIYGRLCDDIGLNRREAALGFVKEGLPEVKIIFGVERARQLNDNILAWNKIYPWDLNKRISREFKDIPDKIINPVLWGKC